MTNKNEVKTFNLKTKKLRKWFMGSKQFFLLRTIFSQETKD